MIRGFPEIARYEHQPRVPGEGKPPSDNRAPGADAGSSRLCKPCRPPVLFLDPNVAVARRAPGEPPLLAKGRSGFLVRICHGLRFDQGALLDQGRGRTSLSGSWGMRESRGPVLRVATGRRPRTRPGRPITP